MTDALNVSMHQNDTLHHLHSVAASFCLYLNELLVSFASLLSFSLSHWLSSSIAQGNGHHQVESHIRKKLDSLLKESRIGDKEDTDSFSIRALLRATHQGLQKNLRQVRLTPGQSCIWSRITLIKRWRKGPWNYAMVLVTEEDGKNKD